MMDPVLPALREDLELLEGPEEQGGRKTFLIRDGVLNRYIRISADTARLLALWRPHVIATEFLGHLAQQEIQVTMPQLMVFLNFLAQSQLICQPTDKPLASRKDKGWRGLLNAGLHNYLFFKIPLIYPDHFIGKHKDKVAFLFSPWFKRLTLFLLVFDLVFMVPRIDHAIDLLSAQGTLVTALKFAIAYIFSKIIHEFAHGFVAARQGCMVSSMGIGFMLAFPVFYADVTDTWRIRDARGRLAVASAGLIAEMTIAIYATALWILNPIPALSSFFLHLALAIWISSLLVNGNPLMRFDGYHILSDFLGEKNLQARSFTAVKSFLRYQIGFSSKKPQLKRVHLVYGFAAVAYRIILITGIALVLYHLAFRLLGIALFAIEIWLFLLAPFWREMRTMNELRRLSPNPKRLRRSALIAGLVLLATFVPFSAQTGAPAVATWQKVVSVYTRDAGQVVSDLQKHPREIRSDETLLALTNPDLAARLEQSETALSILHARRAHMVVSDPDRTRIQSIEAEIDLEQAKAQALQDQLSTLSPHAPAQGLFWPRDDMRVGEWVGARTLVGQIVEGKPRAIAFVSERDLSAIHVGAEAVFTDEFGKASIQGRVTHIDVAASPLIPFPELASLHGGPIEARNMGRNVLVSTMSIYRVEIELSDSAYPVRTLGTVRIYGARRSLAMRAATGVMALFWREARLN